jgi:hypothetical protein
VPTRLGDINPAICILASQLQSTLVMPCSRRRRHAGQRNWANVVIGYQWFTALFSGWLSKHPFLHFPL